MSSKLRLGLAAIGVTLLAAPAFGQKPLEKKTALPNISVACTQTVPPSCTSAPGEEVIGADCVDYGCNGLGTCVNTERGAQCVPVQLMSEPDRAPGGSLRDPPWRSAPDPRTADPGDSDLGASAEPLPGVGCSSEPCGPTELCLPRCIQVVPLTRLQ